MASVPIDNLVSGMATTVIIAFMSVLCDKGYTATQYALLSSLMSLTRDILSSSSGWMASHMSWPCFFLFATSLVFPALILLWYMIKKDIIK